MTQGLYDQILTQNTNIRDNGIFFWQNIANPELDDMLQDFTETINTLRRPPVETYPSLAERKYCLVHSGIDALIDDAVHRLKRVDRILKHPYHLLLQKRGLQKRFDRFQERETEKSNESKRKSLQPDLGRPNTPDLEYQSNLAITRTTVQTHRLAFKEAITTGLERLLVTLDAMNTMPDFRELEINAKPAPWYDFDGEVEDELSRIYEDTHDAYGICEDYNYKTAE